jgi:hypothetical protein
MAGATAWLTLPEISVCEEHSVQAHIALAEHAQSTSTTHSAIRRLRRVSKVDQALRCAQAPMRAQALICTRSPAETLQRACWCLRVGKPGTGRGVSARVALRDCNACICMAVRPAHPTRHTYPWAWHPAWTGHGRRPGPGPAAAAWWRSETATSARNHCGHTHRVAQRTSAPAGHISIDRSCAHRKPRRRQAWRVHQTQGMILTHLGADLQQARWPSQPDSCRALHSITALAVARRGCAPRELAMVCSKPSGWRCAPRLVKVSQ